MRHHIHVALVLLAAGVSVAVAQRPAAAGSAPSADVSLGYNYVGANAPPGVSDKFGLQGGYVSGSIGVRDWLSVAGAFSGSHGNDISALGQDLTLMTFMAGPRVSLHGHRWVPFGEFLLGGAHGSDSYFPTATTSTTSATSFAFSGGGGLDIDLTGRYAIRALNVAYLHTGFPNGATNEQNQLMIGAGLVMRFGGGARMRSMPSAPAPAQVSFTCTADVASIEQGRPLELTGNALTQPSHAQVNYAWNTSGGTVQGTGRRVTINTTGLSAGDYHASGHVTLASDPSTAADCDIPFRVLGPPPPPATPVVVDTVKEDKIFHQNVADALFDYDSYEIRSDAQEAINHAAQYLADNPAIGVLIGGYADERGSAEYNLVLAEKRANAARNALIAAGVAPERLRIISYGKEAQVCTAQTDVCFQQNRRAAFSMGH